MAIKILVKTKMVEGKEHIESFGTYRALVYCSSDSNEVIKRGKNEI